MELFPAIDLKDGACVRLIKGDMEQSTKFNDDPADQAAKFEAMGFRNLHVVDLNGAFDGRSTNEDAVKAILSATKAPVQLGGGIRDIAGIENWLKAGISRVILGTAAVRDPEFVKTAAKAFPNQVAVGIDAINGMVAVEGWAETTDMKAVDLARKFEDSGVCAIIATDIGRDGMKTGVNVEFTGHLADAVSIPIIASGGVKNINDIKLLSTRNGINSVYGTILGRALYDGDINPKDAIEIAR
ncbi:1-(5-phosphoribosyl)-5-[(5-phosphoribosylamino)methylideneamino]imidazole-4-carboxamide isomerase [Hirschia baltica]|uniref:1-(5-phosphoribosyl)-5-[(5-phosphoribosylamino)methylideneamino] imidazole-4-carboxamide isomerase n=1 Tax=Hirschia baltica (strain ATCC 49814 / DSM 5838 / IFAM 1418) TaxID=582402 RepID=C6XIJ5_HIRBI|nr:1-(5-phosphoribosyl)-5-[(5-phosphoribosylamino)methylideneamino]imidazole-4-carboxamide isomerase [Hirschia baltica]ACT60802.1 phosphoribosylformimino-5-aminoimidazole carboxamide ribotide isomerase [Hirschia baltica ATCC 49814]